MNYSMVAQAIPHDADGVIFDVGSLYASLVGIRDVRKRRGVRYALAHLLVAVMLAKLAGQDSLRGIAEWVGLRSDLFVDLFQLSRAFTPHAATFRRVVGRAEILAELERVTRAFLLSAPGAGSSEHLTLDGKKLRGVVPVDSDRGTYLLAVFLPAEGLVLYQVAIDSKSNELPAAPQALKQLDLRGKIVTADALHTQRELSQVVIAGGGDYVWTAKGNQPTLFHMLQRLFEPETCLPGTSPVVELRQAETIDKQHGRLETRRLTASRLTTEDWDWPGLAQVFKLERTFRQLTTDKVQTEVVYGLTSLSAEEADPARLLASVRNHWGIENKLHWRRDALLHEDQTRTKSPFLGQALACLNNLVVGLTARLGWPNLAQARRRLDAHLDEAVRAVMTSLA